MCKSVKTCAWFTLGLAVGTTIALLSASRTRTGKQVYARAKEAREVAHDAAEVMHRTARLRRPLSAV